MKKLLSVLLCAVMVFTLCACGVKEEIAEEIQDATENVGLANPITEYATLQEVNDLLGCKLTHPGVMGVTDEEFAVINCVDYQIGEYEFEVNDMDYTLRFSSLFEHDISGIHVENGTAFSDEYSGDMEFAEVGDYKLARWFNTDGQYCLCVEDEGRMEQAQFEAIALEMQELTNPALVGDSLDAYYASLVGEYQDSVSQRAMATVTLGKNGGIDIVVHWSNSASEYCQWTMNATHGEDGLLSYYDCESSIVTTAEDGTQTVEVLYTDGEGFFSENEGVLYWNGAAEENCQSCTFEKLPA